MTQKLMRLGLLLLLLVFVSFETKAMTTMTIGDAPKGVEVIPLDASHSSALPSSVAAVTALVPGESFVLVNNTDRAITTLVTVWSFSTTSGVKRRRLNLDGYLLSPVQRIVNPHDFALITPSGSVTPDLIPRLKAGGLVGLFGDPPDFPSPDSTAGVQLDIDSVIFENGDITGTDRYQYYREIQDRYLALDSVLAEMEAAKQSGEDIAAHCSRIQNEARLTRSSLSRYKAHYADVLQRTPTKDVDLRLAAFKRMQSQLPKQFSHQTGGKQ